MLDAILRRAAIRLERHPDAGAAGRSFRYRDRSIMPPDNLLDEMETQSCAAAVTLRPVKRFKYALAIASLYAGTVIGHRYRGGRLHPHRDAPFAAAMLDRILNQIGQRPLQSARIASHRDVLCSAVERYFVTGGDRKRSKFGGYFPADDDDIDGRKPVGLLVDALQVQKLIGQRRQTRNVLKHAPRVRTEGQRFQPRLKNRDRRAEFVRRIDKKPLVSLVALIKAAQRII